MTKKKLIKISKLPVLFWIGMLCSMVGIILILVGNRETRLTKDSESWPKTIGIIIKSKVVNRDRGDEFSHTYEYCPKIKYKYTVNGKTYKSDKRTFVASCDDKEWAKSIVKQYPVDSSVEVYYHPEKHKISVLEPEEHPVIHGGIIIGFVFCIVSLVVMAVKIMKKN